MQVVSLVFGILSLIGLGVGFMPCVGWYNWLNIPFAIVGLIISLMAKKPEQDNMMANAGVVCCAVAIVAGSLRLVLGGGVL
jgi:hypothetical protein